MKRFLFLVLALMLCCLVGCDYSSLGKEYVGIAIRPKIKIYSENTTAGFMYAVDSKTKVVYILYDTSERFGITPCYKADGTLMFASDLGLE